MRNLFTTDEVGVCLPVGEMQITADVIVFVETAEDSDCFSGAQSKLRKRHGLAKSAGKGEISFDELP